MKISGFTFVRNGEKLGYPFIESLKSLLPLVDELIVNVPKSDDGTLAAVQAIGDPKLQIFESEWDDSLRQGGEILSLQTNRALEKCSGDWAIYLQADEVIHENDYDAIRAAMATNLDNESIDGLSFRYLHFEGSYFLVNPLRYRRQVRIIRNNRKLLSHGDACGFTRVDKAKLRSTEIDARIFHYGWARPAEQMLDKNRELEKLYHDDSYIDEKYKGRSEHLFENLPVCKTFKGSHPEIMQKTVGSQDTQVVELSRPYFLRPLVWRWLLKKWGITKQV
jgi:glycosyltransferase involved in cell wall biosynthesis